MLPNYFTTNISLTLKNNKMEMKPFERGEKYKTPMLMLSDILTQSIKKTKEEYLGDKDYLDIMARGVQTTIDGCETMRIGYEKHIIKEAFKRGMIKVDQWYVLQPEVLDEHAEEFYNEFFNSK